MRLSYKNSAEGVPLISLEGEKENTWLASDEQGDGVPRLEEMISDGDPSICFGRRCGCREPLEMFLH